MKPLISSFSFARLPLLALPLSLSALPATAADKVMPASTTSTLPQLKEAPVLAQVNPFVTGLKEPQGLALDTKGTVYVAEYKGGQIARFGLDGKAMEPLVTGLKSPALLQWHSGSLYVSERKANRVIKVNAKGKVTPVGGPIVEPLGLAFAADGTLYAVAHTTSKVFLLSGQNWQQIFEPALEPNETKRYGYRCLANEGSALLMSDELSGSILMLTPGGRMATWATGLDDPSGIKQGPDGAFYVADEGGGGKLVRMSAEGVGTVVAKGLGRPRDMLFLDAKTLLVSDRDGSVWKVVLPAP